MRSILLILATLLLLVGGFLVYSWLEPSSAVKPARTLTNLTEKPRAATTRSLRGLQIGDSVWVRRYDQKTGELSSMFKGSKYVPQEDGTVFVENPEAEFFSNDGQQRIRVEGAKGNVVMNLPPEDRPGQIQSSMETEAPSRGKLQDVTISMFDPADDEQPVLVATMNNAAFDNDTFRIATESFVDATGKTVSADEVPVVVRGRDYDFDGRGLLIRWNERDQKLQLLEIAHGESLTVKNPAALSHPMLAPGKAKPATRPSASSAMFATIDPQPVLAAAAATTAQPPRKRTRRRPASIPATRVTIKRDTSPVVYRATFERDVQIFESGKQIVQAGPMNIDFLQADSPDDSPDLSEPTTQPLDEAPAATSRPAHHERSERQPDDKPPAAQPAQGPITLRWQGKLSVVPLDGPPDPTLTPGKARVQLIGSPVLLTRDGTEARCGVATFNTADESASLRASDTVKQVTMTDSTGVKVSTPQLDYTTIAEQRVATLTGVSRAEFPVEADSGKLQTVVADWNDKCQLHLADSAGGALTIEQAQLNGAVKIDHPELKMSSDSLRLAFDPATSESPTTQPAATSPAASTAIATTAPAKSPAVALREVAASGNVKCDMTGSTDLQSIETQNLQIAIDKTPTGQLYARRVVADGDVRTRENGRELRAGQLVAELAPATQPASAQSATQTATTQTASTSPATKSSTDALGGNVKLLSLLAGNGVTLTTPDGQKASADKLIVDARNDTDGRASEYSLIGKPLATVTDGKTTLTGAAIRMLPKQKLARIEGDGTLHQINPDDPKRTEDITWAGGAVVNGNDNTIELRDNIAVKSTQSDGTVSQANADKLIATLIEKPTTQPTTRSIASTTPAGADDMNFLAGKEIGSANLTGNVRIKSETLAPDGSIARALNLLTDTVTYDRITGVTEVPVPGQMLYEDYRPAESNAEETKPDEKAADVKPADANPTLGAGRGKTAFGWQKSLRFDEKQQQAVMTGDVQVVHHPDSKDAPPFNMKCDTLTAFLEADPSSKTDLTSTQPTTATKPSSSPTFRVRRVQADGRVRVTSNRVNFDSVSLSFDPIEQLLTAKGDRANPITLFDNQTGSTQSASEIRWNTKTDRFTIIDLGGKVRP